MIERVCQDDRDRIALPEWISRTLSGTSRFVTETQISNLVATVIGEDELARDTVSRIAAQCGVVVPIGALPDLPADLTAAISKGFIVQGEPDEEGLVRQYLEYINRNAEAITKMTDDALQLCIIGLLRAYRLKTGKRNIKQKSDPQKATLLTYWYVASCGAQEPIGMSAGPSGSLEPEDVNLHQGAVCESRAIQETLDGVVFGMIESGRIRNVEKLNPYLTQITGVNAAASQRIRMWLALDQGFTTEQ